ncbi:MAG: DNA repair protein RecO [Polyangiales bacterium]
MTSSLEDAALVLQRTPLGEHEAIVALLTRDNGSIRAVTSVAPSKTQSRVLEPFHRLIVELTPRRGDLWRLRSSRIELARDAGRWGLDRLERAGTLCRWTRALTPPQTPETDLFDALDGAMERFDHSTSLAIDRRIGARFVWAMLSLLGYPPEVSRCTRCGEARPTGKSGVLRADRDGLLCARCRRDDRSTRGAATIDGASLDAIAEHGAVAIADATIDDETIAKLDEWLEAVVRLRLEHVGSKQATR